MTARPPGPPPTRNPIALVRYVRDITRDSIGFVGRRFREYGDLYYAPVGGTELYVTRHPEHIEEALVRQGTKLIKTEEGRAAARLRQFLGQGLLNANGERWRTSRRVINPPLGRRQIRSYGEAMVDEAERTAAEWRDADGVEVSRAMMELTLRIVTRVLFDHPVRDAADDVAEAMSAFREMAGALSLLPDWLPTPQNRRVQRAIESTHRIIDRMVAERRALSAEELEARDDLLSRLVRAAADDPESFSPKQLRDELLTLFLAGHETTSHALSWTFYLLSENPEVEAKLHAELDGFDGAPTVDDLDALPYTGRVIDEAMRLYPPAPVISRAVAEPVEVGGYTLPEGSELLVWIWWTHHDPRWFPDPERFEPDRFLEDIPKGAYLPFGIGSRLCVGKHFARMEAILVLATLAKRYTLKLAPGAEVRPDPRITLAPKPGVPMVVEARG